LAFTDFMAAMLDADAEGEEFRHGMEDAFRKTSASIDEEARRIDRVMQEFGALVDAGWHPPSGFFDNLIEQNEAVATRALKDQARTRKLLVRITKVMHRLSAQQGRLVEPFVARYDEVTRRYLDVLERILLVLRGLRADAEREQEQLSPAFSDPQELRRHLRSLG
jgi:hypothetical protein